MFRKNNTLCVCCDQIGHAYLKCPYYKNEYFLWCHLASVYSRFYWTDDNTNDSTPYFSFLATLTDLITIENLDLHNILCSDIKTTNKSYKKNCFCDERIINYRNQEVIFKFNNKYYYVIDQDGTSSYCPTRQNVRSMRLKSINKSILFERDNIRKSIDDAIVADTLEELYHKIIEKFIANQHDSKQIISEWDIKVSKVEMPKQDEIRIKNCASEVEIISPPVLKAKITVNEEVFNNSKKGWNKMLLPQ